MTANVTAIPGNTPPEARSATALDGFVDTDIQTTISGYDADFDRSLSRSGTPPQHGTVTIYDPPIAGQLFRPAIYRKPDEGYIGIDSFSFTVSDGIEVTERIITVTVKDSGLIRSYPIGNGPAYTGELSSSYESTITASTSTSTDSRALTFVADPSRASDLIDISNPIVAIYGHLSLSPSAIQSTRACGDNWTQTSKQHEAWNARLVIADISNGTERRSYVEVLDDQWRQPSPGLAITEPLVETENVNRDCQPKLIGYEFGPAERTQGVRFQIRPPRFHLWQESLATEPDLKVLAP